MTDLDPRWFMAAAAIALVLVLDYGLRRLVWARRRSLAERQAHRIAKEARKAAETVVREAELQARERADRIETDLAAREQEQREALTAQTADLDRLRKDLDAARLELDEHSAALARRREDMARREAQLASQEAETAATAARLSAELQEVAAMTRDEARDRLTTHVVEEAREAARDEIKRVTAEAKVTMEERLREMLTRAVQRVPTTGAIESTVSVIRLPSDDMKGRIIGREGRNIRSIEMATGIDLIVDDTPRAILVSCFDPLRREVARIAIERLVEDGRIHPARVEELVDKTREDVETMMAETGDATVFELGIEDLDAKLVPLVGRLKYHTVTGQNLLRHCRETADLAGAMASELGLSPEVVTRAGLLHEIAQVTGEHLTAPSILASAEMVGRHGESTEVQHAIAAIHPDVAARRVDAALTRLACRLSRARPGARKHNLETFISRMRRLEKVARAMDGVQTVHAFRAGKEIRVLVKSEKVSDEDAVEICKTVAGRIEKEVDHTGQVRVSVLRETRRTDFAL
ncbi:MAG: ribonuclease Y [Acidobacteriota bacterium]